MNFVEYIISWFPDDDDLKELMETIIWPVL